MIELKQSWWHIEDLLSPASGKIYRKVMDFHTDERYLRINLINNFLSLKVKNKTNDNYFSFLDITAYEDLRDNPNNILMEVNLGDLSSFPVAKRVMPGHYLYHVRIEIEYLDPCPFFEKRFVFDIESRILNFWNSKIRKFNISCKDYQISPIKLLGRPGYENIILAEGPTQPEFSITVPKGMRLINDFTSTKLFMLYSGEFTEVNAGKAHVTRVDGKESYNFLSDEISIELKKLINKKDVSTEDLKMLLSYKVINKHKFYFLPFLAWLMAYIGYKGLQLVLSAQEPSPSPYNFLFTYIIIQISFLTFYLSLRRENYEIPFNSTILPAIILSFAFLSLCFYYCPDFNYGILNYILTKLHLIG
ncbi:MAG: hypothetical protein CVV28_05250 [Methanobacteriales archaeon HGW-Methanobacteriales-1]|nr:MAG: hypothetical protein CVV28_05250 [Methanobacteriales archaeon HGW-Methanobacteriales-1]